MKRIFSFLGGALAGAAALAAVAGVVTYLTEEAAPPVSDVAPNAAADGGDQSSPTTDNGAESA